MFSLLFFKIVVTNEDKNDKIHKLNGGKYMKVLVCDDNRNFTNIVSNFLSSQNDMEVVDVALNGKEALDKIIKYQPDVVLLDLIMPELDGLGVMERLADSKMEKMPKIGMELMLGIRSH